VAPSPAQPTKRKPKRAVDTNTRDQIVQTAVELFAQRGYAGTSLDDIARVVGIKKPSLYHYIVTKEDLLYEIQQVLVRDMLSELEALLATADTPQEKLQAFFRGALRMIARRKLEMTVFINEAPPDARGRRWKEIDGERDRYQKMFADMLQEGMDAGAFRQLPTTLTALGALGAVTWAYRWYDPDGASPDDVADLFADIVLNGIT
jgi:AcrR family transcriptional regulator